MRATRRAAPALLPSQRGVAGIESRMNTAREAFRLRRLASARHRLWFFYLEHNLFEEAARVRQEVLEFLRRACHQWRRILGLHP